MFTPSRCCANNGLCVVLLDATVLLLLQQNATAQDTVQLLRDTFQLHLQLLGLVVGLAFEQLRPGMSGVAQSQRLISTQKVCYVAV